MPASVEMAADGDLQVSGSQNANFGGRQDANAGVLKNFS
jgi:hypothetical protein